MEINLHYVHAVQDPFDRSIAKPFEWRSAPAKIAVKFDHSDQEYLAVVMVGTREFGGYGKTAQEAGAMAIGEAEYTLMDESRAPWKTELQPQGSV